jgi:hypothetical protein
VHEPGKYSAYCRWAGKYYDPQFKRWVAMLLWDVLSQNLEETIAKVPQWFRLGDDAERPRASLRSKYLREWARANGAPATRGDRLSCKVFVRRIAKIEIADADSPTRHSVVRKIIEWQTGTGTPRTPAPKTQKKGGNAYPVKIR